MGLFSRKMKHPIRGTATVASATARPSAASSAACRVNLVVTLPGMPNVPVEKSMRVAASRWPSPGMVLPIEVDQYDASRVRILWDEVPTGRDRGAAAAADLAAQMNGSGWAPGPVAGQESAAFPLGFQIPPRAQVVSSSVTINGQQATSEQIANVEIMTGMDLNGDGIVGAPDPSAGGPA
ncbi:MAG: hypothetical protein ABI382_05205 [Nakamurella sp.]